MFDFGVENNTRGVVQKQSSLRREKLKETELYEILPIKSMNHQN
jgi:hypothetical protein